MTLTCEVQSCGDGAGGSLAAVPGHAGACLHREGVVKLGFQAAHCHMVLPEGGWAGLKVKLLPTGLADGRLTPLTRHAVLHVVAAARV